MPPFAQAIKQGLSHASTRPSGFNLMLFGAPGVGKGTFGKLIQRDFDFKAFSTGDYFRQVVKMAQANQSGLDDFTLKISEILNSGQLVDDQIVIDIVR